jgi:2-oxoglutarate/2-oxoacid ferredoxin oxidoreductase subunit beta
VLELPQIEGGVMRLRKLAHLQDRAHDIHDRRAAMNHIQSMQAAGEIPTGLLYVDPAAADLHQALNTVARPLNTLREADLCPGAARLQQINAALR